MMPDAPPSEDKPRGSRLGPATMAGGRPSEDSTAVSQSDADTDATDQTTGY